MQGYQTYSIHYYCDIYSFNKLESTTMKYFIEILKIYIYIFKLAKLYHKMCLLSVSFTCFTINNKLELIDKVLTYISSNLCSAWFFNKLHSNPCEKDSILIYKSFLK